MNAENTGGEVIELFAGLAGVAAAGYLGFRLGELVGLRAGVVALKLAREEGYLAGMKKGGEIAEADLAAVSERHVRYGVRTGFREALEFVNHVNRDYLSGKGPWYPQFHMERSPEDEPPAPVSRAAAAAAGFSAADRSLLKGMKIRLDDGE